MKKINVRKVRNNLAEYLKELPFIITKHNKPIAKVVEVIEDERPRTIRKPIKTKKEAVETVKAVSVKAIGFCEHGYRGDLCHHLKCRKKGRR